jgi:DNA-binding transcriptional ArsR family regulator
MTTSVGNGKRDRGIQDAVAYAVGHRIRVEILTALHELGSASAIELSRIVRQPLSTVTHHVSELLKAGSIRIEKTEKVRSVEQRFYCLLNPVYVSDEEWEAMSDEGRQEVFRSILQSLIAEALASFWAGKVIADPGHFISWAWFNVDQQGREDIADEQDRSWRRIDQIEEEAAARCAKNGEKPFSVLVSGLSIERARSVPGPPPRPPEYLRDHALRGQDDERRGADA